MLYSISKQKELSNTSFLQNKLTSLNLLGDIPFVGEQELIEESIFEQLVLGHLVVRQRFAEHVDFRQDPFTDLFDRLKTIFFFGRKDCVCVCQSLLINLHNNYLKEWNRKIHLKKKHTT